MSNPNPSKKIQPGQVLNPYGRSGKDGLGGKTSKSLKKLLEENLDIIDETTGKSQAELIMIKVIEKAKSGDLKAIDIILDRSLGKPQQYIEQHNTGDGLGVLILPTKDDVKEE